MDAQSDDGPPPRRPIPRRRREGLVIEAERPHGSAPPRAWAFAALGVAAGAALALVAVEMIAPPPDVSGLSSRLDALEAAAVAAADQRRALTDRLAAAEAALRRPPPEPRAALPPDARPLAVLTLRHRFDSGAPYAAELAALERLGVSAAALNTLRPFAATGAPTRASLLVKARALAAEPAETRFWGLAKFLKVGESHAAEAGEVEAALARDDLAGALEAFRALPPQGPREAWMRSAEAWTKADEAAEALVFEAVTAPGR